MATAGDTLIGVVIDNSVSQGRPVVAVVLQERIQGGQVVYCSAPPGGIPRGTTVVVRVPVDVEGDTLWQLVPQEVPPSSNGLDPTGLVGPATICHTQDCCPHDTKP